jgi:hypothetical protein
LRVLSIWVNPFTSVRLFAIDQACIAVLAVPRTCHTTRTIEVVPGRSVRVGAQLSPPGPVVRTVCKQGVVGSNPIVSTSCDQGISRDRQRRMPGRRATRSRNRRNVRTFKESDAGDAARWASADVRAPSNAGRVAGWSAREPGYRTAAMTAAGPERQTRPASAKPASLSAAMCQSAGGENSSVG